MAEKEKKNQTPGKLCFYEPEQNLTCEQPKVLELNVRIRNGLLFQALQSLNYIGRILIQVSIRLYIKDAEIADKLDIKRGNVNCIKHSSYEKVRQFSDENGYELCCFAFLGHSIGCRSPPPVLHFSDKKI